MKDVRKLNSYGNKPTHLELRKEVEAEWNKGLVDPLMVYEYAEPEEDGTYLYAIRGVIDRDDMTAEDVNDVLTEIFSDVEVDE